MAFRILKEILEAIFLFGKLSVETVQV